MIRALSSEPLNGRWLLTGLVGRGSSGTVYRGFDLVTERLVAIKTMRPAGPRPASKPRFFREFLDLATVRHPNLVETYEIASVESGPLQHGAPFFTMELLEEAPFAGIHPRPESAVLARLALDLLAALGCIHAHGLVHNDVKPSNVLLERDSGEGARVKLSDLGLATRGGRAGADGASWKGTLHYAAPERIAGSRGDQRADLYSLGVLLYEAAMGSLPFNESDPAAALEWHLRGDRSQGISAGRLSPVLARVVGRLLAVDPGERFARARAAWEEISEAMPDQDGQARRESRWCDGPLNGRRKELRGLAGWLAAASGTGGRLTISGMEGSGLSRFAREAELLGRAHGWAVHGWRCTKVDPPMSPFARPLREIILGTCGHPDRRRAPSEGEILALLGGPALWSAPARVFDEASAPLACSLAGFLRANALARPLLIVLDDFDRADEGTRLVVRYLSEAPARRQARILVVTTVHVREGESSVRAEAWDKARLTLEGGAAGRRDQSGSALKPIGRTTQDEREQHLPFENCEEGRTEVSPEHRRDPRGRRRGAPSPRTGRSVRLVPHRRAASRAAVESLSPMSAILRLGPLSPAHARMLLERLPGIGDLHPHDLDLLIQTAEGMPGRLMRLSQAMGGRQRTLFPPIGEPRVRFGASAARPIKCGTAAHPGVRGT